MKLEELSLPIGIWAMVLLIIGTLVEGGTFLQKILFLIGASVLGFTAWANGQEMFLVLQIVISISAVLAFFTIPMPLRVILLMGIAIVGIAYLLKIRWIEVDRWFPIGVSGLLAIALGFAVTGSFVLLFNSLLAVGGVIVAIYAGLGFFLDKIRIHFIWLILNILFASNPLLTLISYL